MPHSILVSFAALRRQSCPSTKSNPQPASSYRRAQHTGFRLLVAALLLGVSVSACALPTGTPPPPKLTYSATWQGVSVPLTKLQETVQTNVSDAVIQGQIVNFQTNDPKYTCFQGQSLNVFDEPGEYAEKLVVIGVCPTKAGKSQNTSPVGVWTFLKPSQPPFATTASYNGHTVTLIRYNGAIPKGSSVRGQVSQFSSEDPQFTCFNGTFLNVLIVPSEDKEFAGRFIVSDTCSDGKTTASWTFTPIYSYKADWADPINPVALQPYPNPVPQPGLALLGHIHDFATDDPAYTCLNGTFPEARELTATPTEITIIVYGSCTYSVAGAWTFQEKITPPILVYTAFWQDKQVKLSVYTGNPGETQSTGQQLTGFQTNNPLYTCFNGIPLNVVKVVTPAKPELTGAYLVYGSCTTFDSTKPGFTQWIFVPPAST
jgi:hypothetical protein